MWVLRALLPAPSCRLGAGCKSAIRGRIPEASPVVSFISAKTVSNKIWEAVAPDVLHTTGSGFGLLNEAPRSTTVPSVTEIAKSTSEAPGTTVCNTLFWAGLNLWFLKRSATFSGASSHSTTRSRPLFGSSLEMQSSRARVTLLS